MPAVKYNKFPDINPKELNSNEYYIFKKGQLLEPTSDPPPAPPGGGETNHKKYGPITIDCQAGHSTVNSKYNIIKLQIIKQRLFALATNNGNYFLLTGLIETPKLDVVINNDLQDTVIISCERYAGISIPFVAHNNSLFSVISLNNEEEYNTIIKVAEVIL